jgi:hypothetical protein
MPGPRDGLDLATLVGESAIHLGEERRTFEPPVSEELGVERCDYDTLAVLRLIR